MNPQDEAKNLMALVQNMTVEWKPLGEVVPISRGKRLVRSQLQDNGQYPVYQNSLQPLGFYDDQNCRAYMTFVIAAGAAGEIGFSDIEFWAADDCYYFDCPKEILHDKFLYYFLLSERHQLTNQIRKASVPRLGRASIEKIKIPIPPLEIQQKIVKILDKFTELEATLEATLEAELALRKRQYRYYRDFLLDFDNQIGGGIADGYKCHLKDVVWKTLGEVILHLRTGLNPRENFKLNTPDAENFYVTVRELSGTSIEITDSTDKINNDALKIINNRSKLKIGDILFSGTGTIGKTAIISEIPKNWNIKEGVYALTPNPDLISPMFLLRLLQSSHIMNKLNSIAMGSTVRSVAMADLKRIKIPIPPLPEQERIAAILDKFDILTHSISEGLPYEIALRRKQYEYYREQLLAFPKTA